MIRKIKRTMASLVAAALMGAHATTVPFTTGSTMPEMEIKHNVEHYYATTFKITDLDYKTDTIIFSDANGNIWEYEGIEDWELGDTASVLMFDNGTTNIYDDEIVSMRYSSWRVD